MEHYKAFATLTQHHTPLSDTQATSKKHHTSFNSNNTYISSRKKKVNAQVFFLVKKLMSPHCMSTSRIITYTITSGNWEELYRGVYKTRAARGMWKQKGRISAVLTTNPCRRPSLSSTTLSLGARQGGPKTEERKVLLGLTLVMLRSEEGGDRQLLTPTSGNYLIPILLRSHTWQKTERYNVLEANSNI